VQCTKCRPIIEAGESRPPPKTASGGNTIGVLRSANDIPVVTIISLIINDYRILSYILV
jgi:hypothetical protein